MAKWKHESLFSDFITESGRYPRASSFLGPDDLPGEPAADDIEAYLRTLKHVEDVEVFLRRNKEETTEVQLLMGFLKRALKINPAIPIAKQYECLQPLRTWLLWLPVGYLQNYRGSPNSLVVIVHIYTVAIVMERLFPGISCFYFGRSSVLILEEIIRHLMQYSVTNSNADCGVKQPMFLTLMESPIDTVVEFRSRVK